MNDDIRVDVWATNLYYRKGGSEKIYLFTDERMCDARETANRRAREVRFLNGLEIYDCDFVRHVERCRRPTARTFFGMGSIENECFSIARQTASAGTTGFATA